MVKLVLVPILLNHFGSHKKKPENLFKSDFQRAVASGRQWLLDSDIWSRWVFKSSTVGTTILMVTIFSPSVRSVASGLLLLLCWAVQHLLVAVFGTLLFWDKKRENCSNSWLFKNRR